MRSVGKHLILWTALCGLAGCSKSDEAPPPQAQGPACGYHDECGEGGVCKDGLCRSTRFCRERPDCARTPVCAGQSCICPPDVQFCLPVCVTDNECPTDGHCVDGVCTRYPIAFDGVVPGGEPRRQLQVGMARLELDTPVGVSLAGYATRRGPQTPYRDSLGGSNAWFDKPDVRAIVFDDGAEMFVLLRVPISWSTDFVLTDTARKVQARTGRNLIDNIITTAPHSHSHPGRYWHLVVDKHFGIFGYGEFDFEIFDRLTTSLADTVVLALDDMQPARFGYTVIDDFDPDNRIHRDRRKQNNGLPGYLGKDARMVVMRIDDMQGEPRAILTHFGMHGIVFDYDNPIITGDAPGAVETEITRLASQKYGREVMGLFVQGNAGDISPAGDDAKHPPLEQIQLIAQRTWAVVQPAVDAIETRADIAVGISSGRVPITHEILGYKTGEFHDVTTECEETPNYFRFGAFQCVEGIPGNDSDPATKFEDGDLHCVFAVECLTAGYGVPQFQKTRLSAARLGGLAMVTMPGEPLSQFGRDLSNQLLEVVTDAKDALVVGYSQDHHFYLLNEDDWLQGGYEASRDIWGWRLAPYLVEQSLTIAGMLNESPDQRTFDNGNLKPMYWDVKDELKAPVPLTDTDGEPDAIQVDIPAVVRRMEVVRMSWSGGHPGIDRPHIVLETEVDGAWSAVKRPGGAEYDDAMFEMLVEYQGDCNRTNCRDHRWGVSWEERRDFPVGRYRLRVEGRAQKDGAVVDYGLTSRPFEFIATDRLRVYELRVSGDQIEGRVVDPPAVEFVRDGDGLEARPVGHLLRSMLVPARFGAPMTADMQLTISGRIRAPGGNETMLSGVTGVQMLTENRNWITRVDAAGRPRIADGGPLPTTGFMLDMGDLAAGPSGDYVVNVTLTDTFGNSGTATATITR